jgi:hypothetical protein
VTLRAADREALSRIVSLARSGMGAAPAAMANVGPIADLSDALLQSLERRWTPRQILTVEFPGPIVIGTLPLISVDLVFPEAGRIVGVRGIVREGDYLTHVGVQIIPKASGASFVKGGDRGPTFVSLANLQAMARESGNGMFPLELDVKLGEVWTINAKGYDTTGAATYTPEVVFAFEPG